MNRKQSTDILMMANLTAFMPPTPSLVPPRMDRRSIGTPQMLGPFAAQHNANGYVAHEGSFGSPGDDCSSYKRPSQFGHKLSSPVDTINWLPVRQHTGNLLPATPVVWYEKGRETFTQPAGRPVPHPAWMFNHHLSANCGPRSYRQ